MRFPTELFKGCFLLSYLWSSRFVSYQFCKVPLMMSLIVQPSIPTESNKLCTWKIASPYLYDLPPASECTDCTLCGSVLKLSLRKTWPVVLPRPIPQVSPSSAKPLHRQVTSFSAKSVVTACKKQQLLLYFDNDDIFRKISFFLNEKSVNITRPDGHLMVRDAVTWLVALGCKMRLLWMAMVEKTFQK